MVDFWTFAVCYLWSGHSRRVRVEALGERGWEKILFFKNLYNDVMITKSVKEKKILIF